MSLDEIMISRLAFIKYLFNIGIKQSYAPPPLAAISILSFHDSIELFLQLASEYLNTGTNQPNFMDYWDLLSKKLGKEITQRESMRRLNKARVSIKHYGTLPSQMDIEAFRASTVNFFEDNCQIIFGLSFEKISLIELVEPIIVRNKLKTAQDKIANNDTLTALDEVAIAFNELLLDYDETHKGRYGESIFNIGSNFHTKISFNSFDLNDQGKALDAKIEEYNEGMNNVFNGIRNAIKIIVLGLDYVKYIKFLQMVPRVTRSSTGKYYIDRLHSEKQPPSKEIVEQCIDYTIEAAIQIAHVR